MFYRQCEHLRGHRLTQVDLYYYRSQYFLPPMVNQNGMYAIHPPPGFMFMTLNGGLSAFASQRAVYPPSTASAWPVTKLAKGLHSQTTAAAISSGRPSRPIGWSLTISSIVSDSLAIMSATIGVSMVPGHTALMRMPLEAYSSAALFVSPITPCLDAWYVARPAMPIRPPIEEQLTMAPLPRSRIWRSSYFMQLQTPRRLIAFTRSNSSPLASAVSARGLCTPALLNAASSRPKVETVRSTIAATWRSSTTSQRIASALWPAATRSLTTTCASQH